MGRALIRSLNVSQASKLLDTAFLSSSSDSVNGNDLHGGLLQRIPATVPRGPDNAVVISMLCVFLCVLATCKDRKKYISNEISILLMDFVRNTISYEEERV